MRLVKEKKYFPIKLKTTINAFIQLVAFFGGIPYIGRGPKIFF